MAAPSQSSGDKSRSDSAKGKRKLDSAEDKNKPDSAEDKSKSDTAEDLLDLVRKQIPAVKEEIRGLIKQLPLPEGYFRDHTRAIILFNVTASTLNTPHGAVEYPQAWAVIPSLKGLDGNPQEVGYPHFVRGSKGYAYGDAEGELNALETLRDELQRRIDSGQAH